MDENSHVSFLHPLWSLGMKKDLQAAKVYLSSHPANTMHYQVLLDLLLVNEFSAAAILVEAGVSVNGLKGGQIRLLAASLSYKRVDIVRFLLEHGADPYLPAAPNIAPSLLPIDMARSVDDPEIIAAISEYMVR